MRYIFQSVFAAALIAAPICSKAAPRSINDCETIQAADAYNQCLALFGPVARGHGAAPNNVATTSSQDGVAAVEGQNTKVAAASGEDLRNRHGRRHASRHGWAKHRWASHAGSRHGWAKHGRSHHTTAVATRNGKRTTVAFKSVSGRVQLR